MNPVIPPYDEIAPSPLNKTALLECNDLVNIDVTKGMLPIIGNLPPEIVALSLTGFKISGGFNITGPIPEEYGYMGGDMGLGLRFVLSFDLSHNFLTGEIPQSFGNLNVTVLDLSFNLLSGTLHFAPRQCSLFDINTFNLYGNKISRVSANVFDQFVYVESSAVRDFSLSLSLTHP